MKTIAILAAASLALVGCQQRDQMDESAGAEKEQIEQSKEAQEKSLSQEKKSIEQAAEQQKEQASAQAKAEKERIEAQAEAEKAQITAQKKEVEAQADAAKADVKAEEKIEEAAGAARPQGQGATEADLALSKQIKESLTSQNAAFAESGVTVGAMDGKVTLSGTVKTEAEKSALEAQAKAISGVTSVDNKLEVKSE